MDWLQRDGHSFDPTVRDSYPDPGWSQREHVGFLERSQPARRACAMSVLCHDKPTTFATNSYLLDVDL